MSRNKASHTAATCCWPYASPTCGSHSHRRPVCQSIRSVIPGSVEQMRILEGARQTGTALASPRLAEVLRAIAGQPSSGSWCGRVAAAETRPSCCGTAVICKRVRRLAALAAQGLWWASASAVFRVPLSLREVPGEPAREVGRREGGDPAESRPQIAGPL